VSEHKRFILMKQSGCAGTVTDPVSEDRSMRAISCNVCVSRRLSSSSAGDIEVVVRDVTSLTPKPINEVSATVVEGRGSGISEETDTGPRKVVC